ncbi:Nucleoprotein TPR-like isoform X2 [Oopsacas minuta]|uniref:Nucleoprotein TPR-like isoform X2 n=1 Tax=Oopsacas minuta TaxID=111878 RepID=A0AAV7JFB0_9METZ|nr:Nucleoprotein TPR-like isoform X2 [Oopsacas minuta]
MTNLDLSAVFGLDQLDLQQDKARADEEKAREVELKEFLARELPEDLLDDFSESSSEASEIKEDSTSQDVGVPTQNFKVEGITRSAPPRQQPDSQACLLDEQFFHSNQVLVASTPSGAKEGWAPEQPLSPLTVSKETSPVQKQLISISPLQGGGEDEELLGLRILNEARCNEIRTLQEQIQHMNTEYRQQVCQLSEQLTEQREIVSQANLKLEEVQRDTRQSHSHLSQLEQKLIETERNRESLRDENIKMSNELHSALLHLDNCKSQLETLCRTDVIDRLREQHIHLIQESDSDHMLELRGVREETEALTSSYQDTIRRMEEEFTKQKDTYLREIGRLEQDLKNSEGLVDRLREDLDGNELVKRVDQLERELSVSRTQEGDRQDDNKQLELMLESLRTRCSEAEIQKERVVREMNTVTQELTDKLSEAEIERKEGLEQCRAACLQLHEESCNRLREKSTQEEILKRETHEREVKGLTEEITQLNEQLANKEGSVSLQEQLTLKEIHEREVSRLSQEITHLSQQLVNKEGSISVQEQLRLKEIHEREVSRLSQENIHLNQQLVNKEGSVSLQEQLTLKEVHEREVNRLSQEITHLNQQLVNKEGSVSVQEQLTLKEIHEREVSRLSHEITHLKQQLANKEGSASFQEQLTLKEMHEREVNRLSHEIKQLNEQLANKEGSVSLQEQLTLKEIYEREVNRLSHEITQLNEQLVNKEGSISLQEQLTLKEIHEREVTRLSHEITHLKQQLANKEGSVSPQEQLTLKEIYEREVSRLSQEITHLNQQLVNKEGSVSLQEQLTLKEVHEREVNRLSQEITQLNEQLANKEGSVSLQEQLTLKEMHEREVIRLSDEITQLKQQLANKEGSVYSKFSEAISRQERDIRTLSEERNELYNYTIETVHSSFREALNSPDLCEVVPGQFDLPLFKYYPSPHGDPVTEFSSVLLEYMRDTLLSVLRPVCVEKKIAELAGSRDSDLKIQHAVSLALEHAKRQYMKSFSELKGSLTAKYTDKIADMSEGWEQERDTLNDKLEKSRESSQHLKRRLQEREQSAVNDKRKQTEQLTLLQQQLSHTEMLHRKSVQEISQKFARSVTQRKDEACQTDSSDKRYRELFERLLTDLRDETEAVVNKKLSIIEEARRQDNMNAKRLLDSNEQFLTRCRQVINSGKRGTIQDFHSSI